MDERQDFLKRILPYRLGAVEVMGLAIRYHSEWSAPARMEIMFNGKLSIEGLSTAFTNPAIEAGIVHCRALLEFLGLRSANGDATRLAQRASGRTDDLLIENFSNATGPLQLVTPSDATAVYKGPAEEAERALARAIHVTNKGLAHSTVGLVADSEDHRLIEIASRGIPALFIKHFYTPLGLVFPPKLIKTRAREAGEGGAS